VFAQGKLSNLTRPFLVESDLRARKEVIAAMEALSRSDALSRKVSFEKSSQPKSSEPSET
jgi:hypothetical protein